MLAASRRLLCLRHGLIGNARHGRFDAALAAAASPVISPNYFVTTELYGIRVDAPAIAALRLMVDYAAAGATGSAISRAPIRRRV